MPSIPHDVESLPPLYAKWITELLSGSIPREVHATCDNCAMCPKGTSAAAGRTFFDPEVKCCSYTPELPNFLVGQAFAADPNFTSDGALSLRARIADADAVTPLGLGRAPSLSLEYGAVGKDVFGKARKWRCPHFVAGDGGQCSIWQSRNAVCATWFCKHVRGEVGKAFWDDIRRFLSLVEVELALWCVNTSSLAQEWQRLAVAFGFSGSAQPLQAELERPSVGSHSHPDWGAWAGQIEDYYIECWQRVECLTLANVMTLVGQHTRSRAELARTSYQRLLDDVVPVRLSTRPISVSMGDPGSVWVTTYQDTDPLQLDDRLFRSLSFFDGSDVGETLSTILATEHLKIDHETLKTLVDFGVLGAPIE